MEYHRFVPATAAPQSNSVELAAGLFAAIVVIAGLYLGGDVLQPLALAALLSFVLSPIIRGLSKLGVGRKSAVALAVLFAIGSLAALALTLAQQITNLAAEMPRYEATLREKVRTIRTYTEAGALTKATETLEQITDELSRGEAAARDRLGPNLREPMPVEIKANRPAILEQFTTLLAPIVRPIMQIGLVILFALFILLHREDLRDRLLRLGGTRDIQRSTVAMTDAGKKLSRFFLMQTALNAGFAAVITVGLGLIGVPNPLLWGVLAGVMRFVPLIGIVIAAIFPIVLAASVDPGWTMVASTAALFLIAEPIAAQVIGPMLYGRHIGLSPLAVVVATIFWTVIWGPIGLLLATPLTLCLVVLGNYVPALHWLTIVLGDQPALNPTERLYQRLLVGNVAEAELQAEEQLETRSLLDYYEGVAIPALRLAQEDATDRGVPAEYLARLSNSVRELVEDLDDHPLDPAAAPITELTEAGVTCIGANGWVDEASAHLLANALHKSGISTTVQSGDTASDGARNLIVDAGGNKIFFVTAFGPDGNGAHMRYITRRILRQVPDATIVACCWDLQPTAAATVPGAPDGPKVCTTLKSAISTARVLTRPKTAPSPASSADENLAPVT